MDKGMDGHPCSGPSFAPAPRGFSSDVPVESQRERLKAGWGGSAPLCCPQPDSEAKTVVCVLLQPCLQHCVAGMAAGAEGI